MTLRNPVLLGMIIGFVSVFALSSPASAQGAEEDSLPTAKVEQLWPWLDDGQREMVDLIAADFFMNQLTGAQRQRIFDSSAEAYRSADADARDVMRSQRRREWQQRRAAGIADMTAYDQLTDMQKAPFRRHAIDQLGLDLPSHHTSGPVDRSHV